ncbi:MAG: twin-arginine translocase TatA/TatE family subunit [Anaerolineae bacterium]|nr:twin-arginine translocase TatA/TatE family subunit [Anaerolineae bacterium]
MPNLGPTELIIILVIVIIIFGAGKISGLGGALGKTVRDFRSAVKDESKEDQDAESAQPEAESKKDADSEKKEG